MPPQGRGQVNGQATDQAADYAGGLVRLTVPEAAQRLGISENALRKRVQRDTVQWDRDDHGRVIVYLPPAGTPQATDYATDQAVVPAELVESLQEQVGYLRGALDTRDKELAEMRRLLAGALERIPAIEAPPDTPKPNGSPEPRGDVLRGEEPRDGNRVPDAENGRQKPFWRRFLRL